MEIHNNNRGITLIELIITGALLSMVILAATQMITFSRTANTVTFNEYEIQAQMRLAAESITQHMRHATVGFTVTEDQYASGRSNNWSYFALENNKRQIVQYEWNSVTNSHTRQVIVDTVPNISYNLTFAQPQPGTQLIQFKLDGFVDGNTEFKMSVESDLIALNSVVVEDAGSVLTPAVALAYRADDTPIPGSLEVAVTMVLDTSGSMSFDMNGNAPPGSPYNGSIPPHNTADVRIAHLKARANDLIDQFADMENVSVSIIPFAANANSPGAFIAASTNAVSLKSQINGLNASGGTNIGDGMRRGYYRLQEFNTAHPDDTVLSYMILLVDGNPTYLSTNNNGTHQTNSSNISNLSGSGNDSSQTQAMSYVETIGTQLIRNGAVDISTYVIGFSANASDVSRARSIAETYCTHPTNDDRKGTYFSATSGDELEDAFNTITEAILTDVWHIYGPY